MKKLIVCSAMMAMIAAFAGSEGAEGTDWVVTADADETYTIDTAIGNYARLVKKVADEMETEGVAVLKYGIGFSGKRVALA